jgi:signal transduction protein with GAF and PtsI domain
MDAKKEIEKLKQALEQMKRDIEWILSSKWRCNFLREHKKKVVSIYT